MKPELSRLLSAAQADGADILVEARAEELASVARRLKLPEIKALICRFRLTALPVQCFLAQVSLQATVIQICAVTLEPFESVITDECRLRFVPEGRQHPGAPDPEDDDEIPFQNGAIDLGEAAVEQLALALPICPRKPDAAPPEAPRDESANPFAVLGRWKTMH